VGMLKKYRQDEEIADMIGDIIMDILSK